MPNLHYLQDSRIYVQSAHYVKYAHKVKCVHNLKSGHSVNMVFVVKVLNDLSFEIHVISFVSTQNTLYVKHLFCDTKHV